MVFGKPNLRGRSIWLVVELVVLPSRDLLGIA